MKTLLLATLMIITTLATPEAKASSTEEYKGKTTVGLYYKNWNATPTNGSFTANISAWVIETSNDRLSLTLKSGVLKGCGGFAITAIGESDGFGNYDLFTDKNEYLANNSIGTLTKVHKGFLINLKVGDQNTIGNFGFNCIWKIRNGLNVLVK